MSSSRADVDHVDRPPGRRLRKGSEIAAMVAAIGGLDALVFTGDLRCRHGHRS
jgi:hypothetical protein